MGEYKGPFFRRHFVLLGTELVQQLFAHRLEHELQQCVSKDHGRLMSRQTVTERRDVAVAQPPVDRALQKRTVYHHCCHPLTPMIFR